MFKLNGDLKYLGYILAIFNIYMDIKGSFRREFKYIQHFITMYMRKSRFFRKTQKKFGFTRDTFKHLRGLPVGNFCFLYLILLSMDF